MSEPAVTLRRADETDLPYVRSLLAECGLPTADLDGEPVRLCVCRRDGERVGVGGFERYGSRGLLRSVAVEPGARDGGVGTALCGALESTARADGIERLYLLTTTAADFFAGRGYREIERADAPPAIRETTEFASLCPDSATCMRKEL